MLLPFRIGALGAVHHDEIGLKGLQLFVRWADEHVFHEVGLPGDFHDEAHTQARIFVGAAERVDHEEPLAGKLIGDQFFQVAPDFRGNGLVVVLALIRPPDGVLRRGVFDNIFVLGRPAGKNSGIYGDRTKVGHETGFILDFESGLGFFFVEQVVGRIVNYLSNVSYAVGLKIQVCRNSRHFGLRTSMWFWKNDTRALELHKIKRTHFATTLKSVNQIRAACARQIHVFKPNHEVAPL